LEPRRAVQKVAQSGAFWVYFEHLCSDVNGVGRRDITKRDASSAITPLSDGAALHVSFLFLSLRARTFPLPQSYSMTIA
jgi:hypothetical protein